MCSSDLGELEEHAGTIHANKSPSCLSPVSTIEWLETTKLQVYSSGMSEPLNTLKI